MGWSRGWGGVGGRGGKGRGKLLGDRMKNAPPRPAGLYVVRTVAGFPGVAGTLLVFAVGTEMAIKETPSVFSGLCRRKFAAELK